MKGEMETTCRQRCEHCRGVRVFYLRISIWICYVCRQPAPAGAR
jgi:ribosomal protein L37AE/L43A